MNDYRFGDSLKQFMERKEVLVGVSKFFTQIYWLSSKSRGQVLGTVHELEDRNKLKEREIHDLSKWNFELSRLRTSENLYYKQSYRILSIRKKLNTEVRSSSIFAFLKPAKITLNELARKLNDQSRKIDRLKSSRDSLKLQNARLDEELDEISKKRRNLEDAARQIVSGSIRKVSLYVAFIVISIISSQLLNLLAYIGHFVQYGVQR